MRFRTRRRVFSTWSRSFVHMCTSVSHVKSTYILFQNKSIICQNNSLNRIFYPTETYIQRVDWFLSSFGEIFWHMMYSLNIIIICQKRRVSYIIYSLYYISYTRCILYIIYSLNIPTETYMGYVIQNMTSSLFSMMWVFCTYMYVSFPCEIDVQHTPKSVNPLSIRLCRERHAVRNMTFVFFQHDVGLVYKTSILYGKETYI